MPTKENEVRYEELKGAVVVGFAGAVSGYSDIQVKLTNGKLVTLKHQKHNIVAIYDTVFHVS